MIYLGKHKSAEFETVDTIHKLYHEAQNAAVPFGFNEAYNACMAPWNVTTHAREAGFHTDATFYDHNSLAWFISEAMKWKSWEIEYNPVENAFYMTGEWDRI